MFIRIIFPDGDTIEFLNPAKEEIEDFLAAEKCRTYNLAKVDLAIYHCGEIRDPATLSQFENMVRARGIPVAIKYRAGGKCIEVRGTVGMSDAATVIKLFIENVIEGETLKR